MPVLGGVLGSFDEAPEVGWVLLGAVLGAWLAGAEAVCLGVATGSGVAVRRATALAGASKLWVGRPWLATCMYDSQVDAGNPAPKNVWVPAWRYGSRSLWPSSPATYITAVEICLV
ncbi:hypothetical protein SDC9_75225 [bioreactor metagenome]|uniref:Uncharacterized protein n=1 Tax=bioreactor metagenome TaxID=1076179 RepID=A0A644YL36_9ZZZZ